jgi:hypothetical protein
MPSSGSEKAWSRHWPGLPLLVKRHSDSQVAKIPPAPGSS